MATTIAVLNNKGGSGRTTISTNLACALQLDGHSVIIADSDPQETALKWRSEQGDDSGLPDVVQVEKRTLENDTQGFDKAFDFIVIDGTAARQDLTMSAAKAADVIVMPVHPSVAGIEGISDTLEALADRGGHAKACVAVNHAIVGASIPDDFNRAIDTCPLPVLSTWIHQRVAFNRALLSGSSVVHSSPNSKAAAEIRALKDELLDFIRGKAMESNESRMSRLRSVTNTQR